MTEDTSHVSPFDSILQKDEQGAEYWSARELGHILGYHEWRNFHVRVLGRAMISCQENGQETSDHFVQSYKKVTLGSGSTRKTTDYHLTRYACYLTVMNGDPKMPVVAMGQQYFAVQTRRQEIQDELELTALSEDQKRLVLRDLMSTYNTRLAAAAQAAGVIQPKDFATFQSQGYRGLYGGMSVKELRLYKKIIPQSENVLDWMGPEELGANIFRATQTEAKLARDGVRTKGLANLTHFRVGQEVREAIIRMGGMPPEQLPTPERSIKQLQRAERKRLPAPKD